MATSEVIVRSHNILVDTDRGEPSSTAVKGDKFELDLNSEGIHLDEGQYLRLTLNNFEMYKTWTNVNDNNRLTQLFFGEDDPENPGTTVYSKVEVNLDPKNYEFINDIAVEFSDKFKAEVDLKYGCTGVISAVTPDATAGINGTTDNIISFVYTAPLSAAIDLIAIYGRCPEGVGDAYALLGCNRGRDTDPDLTKSYDITITTNTASSLVLTVSMYYSAQRSTSSSIYLRTSLNTSASETASLNDPNTPANRSQVIQSNIWAKIPVNSEFCVFNSNTGREYFIDVSQKYLSHFRLFLTDEHNRPIGRRPVDTQANTPNYLFKGLTSSSAANNQSTLGNLNFSCVIRVDVIQQSHPNQAFTDPYINPTMARQSGLLLNPSQPPI
tara:strand:+ start:616 stop:1764 length:1149 start_codon:yes stop_codon:yes gene_type:complete